MNTESPLRIALGLGLTAYCLVLLISQDAQVFAVLLMGCLSLILVIASMGLLWREKTIQEKPMKSEQQQNQ